MVLDHKAPQSYLLELGRGQRRWLHANKLRPYHARVNAALVYNCAIVYDEDEDFGTLQGAAVCNDQALPSSKVDLSKLSHLGNFYGWLDSAQIFCGFIHIKHYITLYYYYFLLFSIFCVLFHFFYRPVTFLTFQMYTSGTYTSEKLKNVRIHFCVFAILFSRLY